MKTRRLRDATTNLAAVVLRRSPEYGAKIVLIPKEKKYNIICVKPLSRLSTGVRNYTRKSLVAGNIFQF